VHSPVSEEEEKPISKRIQDFRVFTFRAPIYFFDNFITIGNARKISRRVLMNNRQTDKKVLLILQLQYQCHGFSIVLQYKTARLVHP
jgi:hypothetical protein